MNHKCDGCRYKGEHREMKFRPFGVCTKETNLIEAEKAYNAEKCPYKKTNADRIRAMSDEELTDAIYRLIHANDPALWFCKGTKECGELMDNDEEIPEEMCRKCLLEKIQQPAEEG